MRFCIETAWLMSCLSELSYLKFNKKNFDDKLGKHNVKFEGFFNEGGTQALLVSNDKFLALAFRGTEITTNDIKTDFNAKKITLAKGKVHRGFNDALDDVIDAIQSKLKQFNKQLFLTGHSLGGALATIACKRLKHDAGIKACYTFGAPRIGDQEFCDNISTRLFRVVNAADFVTMVPPKFLNYQHYGEIKYLTNSEKPDYSDTELLNDICLSYRIKMLIYKFILFKRPLRDHKIKVYRKKLRFLLSH